jgi:hypothetical protein
VIFVSIRATVRGRQRLRYSKSDHIHDKTTIDSRYPNQSFGA